MGYEGHLRYVCVTIAFSSFPGIHARFGKWTTDAYPGCGCDACDETAGSEIERLNDMIHNVTRGRRAAGFARPWANHALV